MTVITKRATPDKITRTSSSEYPRQLRVSGLETIEDEIRFCINMMKGGPYDPAFLKSELPKSKERILASLKFIGDNTKWGETQRAVYIEVRELIEHFTKESLERALSLTCGLKVDKKTPFSPSQKGA